MLLIWQTGKSLPGRTYFQSSPFKSSGERERTRMRAGKQEWAAERCVSSCCPCRYCWQWHLNVRIAPVLSGRIRAAMWKKVSIGFSSSQGGREPLCWCQHSRHVPAHQGTVTGQLCQGALGTRTQHNHRQECTRAVQVYKETLTLRALPWTFSGKQNKTPKPVPSHVCLCSVARDGEGECHFWNADHISF